MSKNEKIKLLHDTTRVSFKDCRAALNRNNWDFFAAYIELNGGLPYGMNTRETLKALNAAVKALSKMFENLREPFIEMFDYTVTATAKIVSAITPEMLARINGEIDETPSGAVLAARRFNEENGGR